jgi:hypothetical protein
MSEGCVSGADAFKNWKTSEGCVNGADALTNWIRKKACECIAPLTHAWTQEKNRLILIILQFDLFPILIINLISGVLSIGHYFSFPSAAAILLTMVARKVGYVLKSSLSYERIKNKQVLLFNQKARKRYTLIL